MVASTAIRLALQQATVRYHPQHPLKHCAMTLEINEATCAGNRRVIRRHLVQSCIRKNRRIANESARAPGDPAFAVDPLEVADQQQSEVPIPGAKLGRPITRRVEPRALAFDKPIEVVRPPATRLTDVERMSRS